MFLIHTKLLLNIDFKCTTLLYIIWIYYCVYHPKSRLFYQQLIILTLFYFAPPFFPALITIFTIFLTLFMSFFHLILLSVYNPLSKPISSDICQSVFSIYDSICILFVCLFCSLGYKYNWIHMAFLFLWLAYFT